MSNLRLSIQTGTQAGQVFQLRDGSQTIGRAPSNPIVIAESTISKQHAQITVQPDGVWIQDLGSSNGTFVNGKRISESTWLKPGDTLQFGTSVVVGVQRAGGAAATSPSNTGWVVGLVVLLAALLLIGLGIGGWYFWQSSISSTAPEVVPPATDDEMPVESATDTPIPEPVVEFTTSKTTVQLGECLTLRWNVSHAKEVRLDGELVPANEERKVCPQEATKTYRLTALSFDGQTTEEVVSVTVPPTPLPPPGLEIDFSADQDEVDYGSCTTLRWNVKNAQTIRLNGEKVGPQGDQNVCPTDPANTYQLLIAPLEGDLVEQTVIINVPATPLPPSPTPEPTPTTATQSQGQTPVIDKFIADQATLNAGSCTTLRWTVRNAQTVQVSGGEIGSQTVGNQGAKRVCPPATGTIYTLTASGSGGNVQASITINISAAPTQAPAQPIPPVPSGPTQYNLTASPNPAGNCTTLSWYIEGVQAAYLDGGQFNNQGVTGPTGQTQACDSGSVTYVLKISLLGGGGDSRSVTVTFTGGGGGGIAPSVTFSHDGTFLHWDVKNAASAFIDCYDTGGHHVAGGAIPSDSGSDLPPTTHGRCTLTAIGSGGSTTTKTVTF